MINWFDVSDESPNKDLALKNLKVTQNGTYGESGVAYSSVEVNVSGGGGGSSDFSTAEVTFICNVEEVHVSLSIAEEVDPPFVPDAQASSFMDLYENDETTVSAILYKGLCFGTISTTGGLSVTATGDIEVTHNTNLKISGAGTITINPAQS